MKNGDERSAKWIARHLRGFQRDNERLLIISQLIEMADIPVAVIEKWSDADCLLAEDYISSVHYRASDNNNRVPACPPCLFPYLETPQQKKEIVK